MNECAICNGPVEAWPGNDDGHLDEGFGHNPEPVKDEGRACNWCNENIVIPVRIRQMTRERI